MAYLQMQNRQRFAHFVRITLPLSGRQGAWGGVAEFTWWPVHSRGLLAGQAADRLPGIVAVRKSSMMSECPSQPSGEPLESKLSEADDGRPVTVRTRRFFALSYVSAGTRDWHTLIPAYTTTTPT